MGQGTSPLQVHRAAPYALGELSNTNICSFQGSFEPIFSTQFFHTSLDTTHGKSDYHFSSYDDNENYHFSFQNFTDSINESDIDKIFNRFYTTDLSRSRKTTGLGLTIAKNLTVKMGGSISASLNNNVFEIVVCFPKQKG